MDFYTLLNKELEEYYDGVLDVVNEKMELARKRAMAQIKETSPKDTGDYARNWTSTVERTGYGKDITIHNKEDYRLTHLLEKPHALRNGGRSEPQPHIAQAQKDTGEFLEAELLKGMGELGH